MLLFFLIFFFFYSILHAELISNVMQSISRGGDISSIQGGKKFPSTYVLGK